MTTFADAFLSTNLGFDAYMKLRWRGRRGTPQVDWINSALKSQADVDVSVREAQRLNLPPCPDPAKTWDSLAALHEILQRTAPEARILDAGAELYSRLLPWLYLYGYRNLHGINLVFQRTTRTGSIVYEPGDITRTRFDDGHFDAVGCLSVIEHGVDLEAYFREMARILKPGGVLVTSTDYFESPTETRGLTAYGTPIRVFTRGDIESALATASACGLQPTGPVRLESGDRVVRWAQHGLEYTFLVFALTKTSS